MSVETLWLYDLGVCLRERDESTCEWPMCDV